MGFGAMNAAGSDELLARGISLALSLMTTTAALVSGAAAPCC